MFRMQMWQWIVVGVVAAVCVGTMSFTVARMFSRRASSAAASREATAFESAAATAPAPAGAHSYDSFAYRVPARFAGRTRIVVDGGKVSVAGPRVSAGLYRFWIWLQALVLALVPAAIVAALVKLDWRWAGAALGVFVLWFVISSAGAVAWPGMGELDWIGAGRFKAVEFRVAAVHDVKIGEGWADGGIDLVQLPIKGGIDAMAKGHAVSFTAPDEDGYDVRYALHVPSAEDAASLAGLLVK